VAWKDVVVLKPYPREFGDDVVRVARGWEAGVRVEQVAEDFGVHPMTLFKWLRQADQDVGVKHGASSSEAAELREARRRIRVLEQGTRSCVGLLCICRRRTCREKGLPVREGAGR
jgi:transposase